jgi:hypothetical protein
MESDFETLVNLRDGIAKMKKAVDEMKDAKEDYLDTCNPEEYQYCLGQVDMLIIVRNLIKRIELESEE